jgi:hypothetical protein
VSDGNNDIPVSPVRNDVLDGYSNQSKTMADAIANKTANAYNGKNPMATDATIRNAALTLSRPYPVITTKLVKNSPIKLGRGITLAPLAANGDKAHSVAAVKPPNRLVTRLTAKNKQNSVRLIVANPITS